MQLPEWLPAAPPACLFPLHLASNTFTHQLMQEIQHVQEYQPSEHGSDGFTQRALGCNCCIQ